MLLDAIRVTAEDPSLEWLSPPEPLAGGFWAELWRIRLDIGPTHELAGDLVARIMPDPNTAARETIVQKFLANHGFATPSVRLWAGPTTDLDSAWMLMDLVDGEPLMPSLDSPAMLASLPRIARSMPDTLALCAAELHQVPTGDLARQWNAVQDNKVTPGSATGEYLQGLLSQAQALDSQDLAQFADFLSRSRASLAMGTDPEVICHGDLQPFNVLVSDANDRTATGTSKPIYTVLDWSTARITNRCHDLAYTTLLLISPPLTVPGVLAPIIKMAGRFLSQRFLRSYERFSGITVDSADLDWFVALHSLRVMIDVATWKHEGTLEQHSAHPYLLMDPILRKRCL